MKLNKIQSDDRGEIYLLEDLAVFPEITIFKTKAGYARGGCVHDIHQEFVCVLEGEVVYVCGDNTRRSLLVGETVLIPAGTPHYYISTTDSLVAEWGATPAEKKNKHLAFREIVDGINKKHSAV